MSSRNVMRHRATIERNSEAGTDPHGNPLPPVWAELATLACFAWSRQSRQAYPGDRTALVEDLRAMFPLGADLRQGDRIASIRDRTGTVIIEGPLRVDAEPQFKHNHVEVALKRVAS
ncbi:MAG: head-tail adaptor protein [Nitratireductor sp.]